MSVSFPRAIRAALIALATALICGPFASSAAAANRCPAFVTWEDWIGGARVHAYVDFRASDLCNGRHVRAAYVRFQRSCGPALDSGRLYVSASGPSDTALRVRSEWVWDSLLWNCNTRTYYGWDSY